MFKFRTHASACPPPTHISVTHMHVSLLMLSNGFLSRRVMVYGYHVYKDIWTAVVGEEFSCRQEDGNQFDPFAVAVTRGGTVIGHVLRKTLSIFSLFLRRCWFHYLPCDQWQALFRGLKSRRAGGTVYATFRSRRAGGTVYATF